MTDKERLTNIIHNAQNKYLNLLKFESSILADYLLANGVILPPCKVGDTVWHKEEGYLLDSYKIKFIYNDMTASNISRDLLFSVEDIGKTVFFTKEEAEKALATDTNVGNKKEREGK